MTSSGPLVTAWRPLLDPDALAGILAPALPGPTAGWTGPVSAALADQAARESGTPWPSPQASHYARFHRDGIRTAHEDLVRARQARLTRAVVRAAAALDGDRLPLLDEVADGVLLLCEQTSWCWVAHDPGPERRGSVVPPVEPWLDLGAGEIAAQLAWVDRLLGDDLDDAFPGLRERVRAESSRRVLEPFLDRDWHWLTSEMNNWCPWICGNVLAAAIQLLPAGPRRTATVARAIGGLDRYLVSIPEDGSVDEGYGYWWEGVGRALEALDVLERVTGGRLSAAEIPAIRASIAFPHRMHLGGPWHVNVADAAARPQANVPWDVLLRWAHRIGDDDARRYALSQWAPSELSAEWPMNLARVVGGLEALGSGAAGSADPPLVGQVWLPDVQIGLVREHPGRAEGLVAVLKGGHNAESHNHNDVGSVIVASDGVPVLVDPGRLTYSAGMFGPERYEFWAMQSRWHNVPVVAGHEQTPGRARRARGFSHALDGDTVTMSLDLAAAYPDTGLDHWVRTLALNADGSCIVEDDWAFTEPVHAESCLHWMIAGEVTRVGHGRIDVVPLAGGAPVRIVWTGDVDGVNLTERHLEDPMLTSVWGTALTRLELRLGRRTRGSVALRVERR
ncbi:heparinase II/III domain-containing protein [Ruania rhizosphaerae]|uniref:heparinase II/III domain-containing protein n=1 Tax=Ruania rhizosphaerae TaxID=1840413 RepID=UPI001356D605|nr:heparinase II/III family protein [Ruania rhizosphaerae]